MDEIPDTILKDTYSLSLLKHRLRVLRSNLLKTFFGGADTLSLEPADLNWLKSLPPQFYQKFTKDNVYQVFTALEAATPKLATLTLYLTFEPDEPTLAQIGAYCRKTFNSPALLLDIKLDPNLIAGASLVWKGVYRDYSLRAQIESKRQEIAQIFKRFLR